MVQADGRDPTEEGYDVLCIAERARPILKRLRMRGYRPPP